MGKMSLKPLEDRIVVKPGEEEETTVSGIVIPDTAKEKPQEGSVVAVGPAASRTDPRPARRRTSATRSSTAKYGGTEVKVEGEDYLILSARDVLASRK
jgi:chaperonin GroES